MDAREQFLPAINTVDLWLLPLLYQLSLPFLRGISAVPLDVHFWGVTLTKTLPAVGAAIAKLPRLRGAVQIRCGRLQ